MNTYPRCRFMARYPAGGGKWLFRHIDMLTPEGGGRPLLEHPPAPGDLIALQGAARDEPGGPVFRVIDRMWVHPAYGSGSWPFGSPVPQQGPMLEIIVEPAEGLYADETPHCGESECDAYLINGRWELPDRAVELIGHRHYEKQETVW
jgi:hypothetical protein